MMTSNATVKGKTSSTKEAPWNCRHSQKIIGSMAVLPKLLLVIQATVLAQPTLSYFTVTVARWREPLAFTRHFPGHFSLNARTSVVAALGLDAAHVLGEQS